MLEHFDKKHAIEVACDTLLRIGAGRKRVCDLRGPACQQTMIWHVNWPLIKNECRQSLEFQMTVWGGLTVWL